MREITLPTQTVNEVAALLGRPADEIQAADIVNALRRHGKAQPDADGDSSRTAVDLDKLEQLFRPVHDAVMESLQTTVPGRTILAAREGLDRALGEIDDRELSGDLDGRVARYEKTALLDEFQQEHERELLGAASDHAELIPSAETLLQIARPFGDESWRQWIFEVVPLRGILLRPPKAADTTPAPQGMSTPTPPRPIYFCITHPYSVGRTHEDGSAVASDWSLNADKFHGDLNAEPAVWSPGSLSGYALVGEEGINLDAGLYDYELEVAIDYEYSASCWTFMSVAGTGVDFRVEVDNADGSPITVSYTSMFSLHSYVVGGIGGHESGTKTLTVPFHVDGSARKISMLAGVDYHCEAGGSPGSGYAGVNVTGTVKDICLRSL